MSTYTDLRNRVKENITVGYDQNDRATLQKARFLNEENEYWGTFLGKAYFNRSEISGSVLNDISVDGGHLKNVVFEGYKETEEGERHIFVQLSDILDINEDKLSKTNLSAGLLSADTLNTMLSGNDVDEIAKNINTKDIVKMLMEIKNIFSILSC